MPVRRIHDRARTRTKMPLTSPEWISGPRLPHPVAPRVAWGHTGDRILQDEVRCRAQKCRNRLPSCLVQIGGAPTTQHRRSTQTRLGLSALTPADRGTLGFGEGTDRHDGGQPLRTPSAAPALGWAPWVGVRPPMHTDMQGKQNRPFRAPRANFPCRIALYPGGRLSGPHLDDC